jgi:hypothetical protein
MKKRKATPGPCAIATQIDLTAMGEPQDNPVIACTTVEERCFSAASA